MSRTLTLLQIAALGGGALVGYALPKPSWARGRHKPGKGKHIRGIAVEEERLARLLEIALATKLPAPWTDEPNLQQHALAKSELLNELARQGVSEAMALRLRDALSAPQKQS